MSKIIADFLKCAGHRNGFGFFEGNERAALFAKTISISQRRKYVRYGTIPIALFQYLISINAIQCNVYVPENERTISVLLDLLWEISTSNGHEFSEGEALRVALLTETMPWLERSLGSSQHIWKVLEKNGKLFGLKRY